MEKEQIKKFLKDYNIKIDDLSRLAGLSRWTLRRWLYHSGKTIMLSTANKIELAMLRIKNNA